MAYEYRVTEAEDGTFPVELWSSQGESRQRKLAGQIVAGSAVEAHPWPILAGHDPVAVALDLVQPARPGRRAVGR